jgi:predicted dehydrogenase
METLRVGIIGCGNITVKAHAPALQRLPSLRVTGVADPTAAARARVQAMLDLDDSACSSDYRALLDAGVDYVVLNVPQRFRRAIVEDCAQAGVHVLCEKPIATVPADGRAMIDAMRAARLRFGMVHNYLYYPEYVLARQLIESGAIGQVGHIMLNLMGMPDHPGTAEYRPAWRHDPLEAGGGVLMDMVHVVYLSEWFLGGPIQSVSAAVDNMSHPGDTVEDFTLVNFAGQRAYASVNMWWGGGPGGLEISGSDGRVVAYYENYDTGPFTTLASFTLVNGQGRREFEPRAESALADNFVRIHEDFAQAVRTGSDSVAPAEAGLRSLEAALASYVSAATGRVTALPLGETHPVYLHGVAGLGDLAVWQDSPVVRKGILGLRRQE